VSQTAIPIVCLVGFAGLAGLYVGARPAPDVITGQVTHIMDGDTIGVRSSGDYLKVRLLGIDTPESGKRCGSEASENMRRLALGKQVTLRVDPSQAREDRYGRLLAYADVSGKSLQIAQLAASLARVYVYQGNDFDRLDAFSAAAKKLSC